MERAAYGSIDLPLSVPEPEPASRKHATRRNMSPRIAAGALALLSLLIAFVLVAVQRYDERIESKTLSRSSTSFRRKAALFSTKRPRSARNEEASSSTLDYEVENTYRTFTRLTSEYPWLNDGKLIEPHRETTLRILNPSDSLTYIWDFYLDGSSMSQYEGSEVTVVFTSTGTYDLYLRAVDDDGKGTVSESVKEEVFVKYVRRELRSLTEDDRKAFFDAMSTIWNTDTEEGQSLYGDSFYNIDYFNKYHLLQASSYSCDHMHDGLGFMTQHVALTIKFERSLQAVAPALAMPYWDFTIDAEDIFLNKDGNFSQYWFDAEVFDDDWFGRVDPKEHTMTKGRWAYTEVKKGDSAAGDVMNAYGYLRAPWNANGNKYVTRYSTFCGEDYDNLVLQFPSCKVHYNAVAGYNTFNDFAWFLPYDPHGPVHVLIGGTFGCEEAWVRMKDFKLGQDFYSWLAMFSFMSLKNLYRGGLLTCPDTGSCDDSTAQSDCRCTCEDFETDMEAGDWAKYFKIAVAQNKQTTIVYEQSDEVQIEFIRTLCNSGIMDGDNLESASPMDPSFWPIHPAIERLWVLKKLRSMFLDETWPTTGVSSYGDDCTGHYADDTIPLQGIFEDGQMLTNAELLSLMDPNESSLPYVYDNFDWDHCLDVGVDFSDMTLGQTLTYGPSS